MKNNVKFVYWNPGDDARKNSTKIPRGCQCYNEVSKRWELEDSTPFYWKILKRRWPKAKCKAKEDSKPVAKPCKYEKILVELLKQTRVDHDTFGKPLIRFGSFFPTIDNPKLNRQLMRLRKKHDDKTRPNVR